MRSLAYVWQRFWFAPVEPTNLALCRLIFLGGLFLYYLPIDFSAWGDVVSSFWMPTFLFKRLQWSLGTPETLMLMQIAWKSALALGCTGCFTRLSTLAAFGLGVYLIGLPHNLGKVHHSDALVVLLLGVLATCRCGDAYSVDQWIRRRRAGVGGRGGPSGDYLWPIRLVWVLFALVFFAAGVSKLRESGWEWAASDNVAILLVQHQYHVANADPWTSWGLVLANHGWPCRLLAAQTLVIELFFPLGLLGRKTRWLWLTQAFLMQIGIRALMGPSFSAFLICYVFWVPWDALVPRGDQVELAQDSQPARSETMNRAA